MKPLEVYQLKQQVAQLAKTADVAKAFGRTEMTVYNWRTYRGLPYMSLSSFSSNRSRPIILFDKAAVVRWARLNCVPIDETLLGPRQVDAGRGEVRRSRSSKLQPAA